jgi:hypothetical protein
MRRLRAGFAASLPGGRGSPSGPTTGLCRCVGWTGRVKAGESRPDNARPAPGSTVPQPKIAAMARREATRTARGLRTPQVVRDELQIAPVGAPFPSVCEGHTEKARLARRRDADGAWARERFHQEVGMVRELGVLLVPVRREALLRRTGNVANAGACYGPGSARQHVVSHRARGTRHRDPHTPFDRVNPRLTAL